MTDPGTLVALVAAAVIALAMMSLAALKGWRGWLELRRMELDQSGNGPNAPPGRLELADLKDRVKRLEAIANGDEEEPLRRSG